MYLILQWLLLGLYYVWYIWSSTHYSKLYICSLYLFVVCDLIKVTKDLQIAVKQRIKWHAAKRDELDTVVFIMLLQRRCFTIARIYMPIQENAIT